MLYAQGPLKIVAGLLKDQRGEAHQSDADNFQKEGIHVLCLAERELEDFETFDLVRMLGEVSMKQKE